MEETIRSRQVLGSDIVEIDLFSIAKSITLKDTVKGGSAKNLKAPLGYVKVDVSDIIDY